MRVLTIAAGIFLAHSTFAQSGLSVTNIKPELLKNSDFVIRNEEQSFRVSDPGHGVYNYHIIVTILNKNGDGAAQMSEYYDKFSSVTDLRASMYDATGAKIKEYRTSDFKDNSMISDFSIYEDNRLKSLRFLSSTYPFTIEYSYTKNYNGLISYPSWSVIGDFAESAEKSSYKFTIPKNMSFRYKKSPLTKTDSVLVKDDWVYTWQASNLEAFEYEPMSAGIKNLVPWVVLAPNTFEFDKSTGSTENWQKMGEWIWNLNLGGDILTPEVKEQVAKLTANAKTDKEKVEILYQYLQDRTRYVSVQLGIGGFKPINADKVAQVNYGDCKALSNYMKALLKEAKINSNLVVIGNDMPSLKSDFASFGQANHMILCVPAAKDTTWLECTSQHIPAGYIGGGNSNRTVLLVTESGGKLAKTPFYSPKFNSQIRNVNVDLASEGNSVVDIKTVYSAEQFESHYGQLFTEPVEQKKRIYNSLAIPNSEIQTFSYVQPDKKAPVLQEDIKLTNSQLVSKGGDKAFITLNLLNRRESVPQMVEKRKTPFKLSFNYLDKDEIVFNLPKDYKVEFVPKDVTIASEFGNYSMKTVVENNKITYVRTQEMNEKVYPPEKYPELVDFYKKIYQADKQKAVLVKAD